MPAPAFLLGKHLTTVTIAGILVDASGNVSVGAAQSVRAYVSELDAGLEYETEDIRPLWSLQKNEVVVGVGNSLRLACLQRSDAANVLRQMAGTFHQVRVLWVQGAETFQGDYTVQSLRLGLTNRGGNLIVLELVPFDNGTAYAGNGSNQIIASP